MMSSGVYKRKFAPYPNMVGHVGNKKAVSFSIRANRIAVGSDSYSVTQEEMQNILDIDTSAGRRARIVEYFKKYAALEQTEAGQKWAEGA